MVTTYDAVASGLSGPMAAIVADDGAHSGDDHGREAEVPTEEELSDLRALGQILMEGPIDPPTGGDSFNGGCQQWAEDQISTNPDHVDWIDTAEEYSVWLRERIESSPEMARVNVDFAQCMAEQGYPEIGTPEDVRIIFVQNLESMLDGDIDQPEAAAYDAEIMAAFRPCEAETARARALLRDQFAREFFESSD